MLRSSRRDAVRRYSTVEVMNLTGASYRQCDYWCRAGLIPGQPRGSATGSGGRRRWTVADVERARLLLMVSRIRNRPMVEVVHELERTGLLAVIAATAGTALPPPPPTARAALLPAPVAP